MVHEPHERLVYADEVFRIQGAVFEVNRVMGTDFLEAVYQECLPIEFGSRGIAFAASPKLTLGYKGASLRQYYCPDFICFERVVVD